MVHVYTFCDVARMHKDGRIPVLVVVKVGRQRFMVNSGLTTKFKFTGRDFPRQEDNFRAKTNALSRLLLSVEELCLRNEDKPVAELKQFVRGLITGAPREKTLVDYINAYAETAQKPSTATLYEATARRVEAYDKKATLESVNREWVENFYNHLRETMTINGAGIQMRNIRAVFNRAIDDEVTNNYPFRKFRIKQEQVPVKNLTLEQLRAIRDYPCEAWQRIYRDLFMLSFYLCGINPGDLLLCESLTNGRMVYHRQKTGVLISVPVCHEAQEIIDRYKGEKYLLSPMDRYSSYRSFQHAWNDALKKIGPSHIGKDRVGKMRKVVYEPIAPDCTIYTARYTFGSIAAEAGVSRDVIALCLGHSWADVTARYVSYNQKMIDDAVRKVLDYIK